MLILLAECTRSSELGWPEAVDVHHPNKGDAIMEARLDARIRKKNSVLESLQRLNCHFSGLANLICQIRRYPLKTLRAPSICDVHRKPIIAVYPTFPFIPDGWPSPATAFASSRTLLTVNRVSSNLLPPQA